MKPMQPRPASHRLRIGRWGEAGIPVAVTKRRHPCRRTNLAEPQVAGIIAQTLLEARRRKRCYLLAWCLMPDHIHIVLSPREESQDVGARSSGRSNMTPLSRVIGDWANAVTHLVNRATGARGPLWQEGFFDHTIRRDERVEEAVVYIHANPVRRGMVLQAEEWLWSSASAEFAESTDWDWLAGNRPGDGDPTD